jgi:hypothetical protein
LSTVSSVLELKQSGATISWDYFNRHKPLIANVPVAQQAYVMIASIMLCSRCIHLIRYNVYLDSGLSRMYALVEDNDLWRHSIADSKDFTSGIANLSLEWDATKNTELFSRLLGLGTNLA